MGGSYSINPKTVYLPPVLKRVPDMKVTDFPMFLFGPSLVQGKIVAITGTTSGTGYQVAKYLGMKGARVLLLNRKSSRSEASEKKLKEE
eukprot:1376771-Amorphochlora_amoeboformis.AAC.1